jgi:hypothetical protein
MHDRDSDHLSTNMKRNSARQDQTLFEFQRSFTKLEVNIERGVSKVGEKLQPSNGVEVNGSKHKEKGGMDIRYLLNEQPGGSR